jgi:hypothetical protein
MKISEIRNLLDAEPFRPFTIRVADGGRIRVVHPDFVALAPSGREMSVYHPDGDHQIIDVPLATRLEITGRNGSRKSYK